MPSGPRIDVIKKAGVLRVAVLANAPWLVENTTGEGDHWSGPAWQLSEEYAKRLGVKLQPVRTLYVKRTPVLAANQVDISITALAETPERDKVVDFFGFIQHLGLHVRPRRQSEIRRCQDRGRPEQARHHHRLLQLGGAQEALGQQRFPQATFLGVANSGATAPLEDIMAKRADAAPINRIPYVPMARKVKGLAVLPSANNCQDSTEKAQPVGMAVDKNQPAFLDWLRAVEKDVHAKLVTAEQDVVSTMK